MALDIYGGDGEDVFASPLDGVFDEETLDKIAQCGVDLDQVMNEYFDAIMNAAIQNEDQTAFFVDLMNEWAEDGEQDCTKEQMQQYENAADEYAKCAGAFGTE